MDKNQIIEHNGKKIKIEFRDYKRGDQNILTLLILQDGVWVSICDHNLSEEV